LGQPDITSLATNATGSAGGANVRAAIAQAAQASGVDFNYLLAQARLESSLNPAAHASTSSAAGLYQFTNATWANTAQRHPDALAQAGVGAAGVGAGGVAAALSDPAARARLMALRYDPAASAMMAAQLTGDNQAAMTTALGHAPDPGELYMAHVFGVDGASKLLNADPSASAASILPKAAAANRAIFYDASGAPRSVGQVTDMLRAKVQAAMSSTSTSDLAGIGAGQDDSWALGAGMGGMGLAATTAAATTAAATTDVAGGPIARQFAAAQAQDLAAGNDGGPSGGPSGAGSGGSMADTLRNAFGIDANGASAPDYVRTAYARMQAMGF